MDFGLNIQVMSQQAAPDVFTRILQDTNPAQIFSETAMLFTVIFCKGFQPENDSLRGNMCIISGFKSITCSNMS